LIETEADIKAGIKVLRRKCDVLRRIHDEIGDPPVRRTTPGFEGLARIVIGQQVSVASANAIWNRFSAVASPMTAARVATLTDDRRSEPCAPLRPRQSPAWTSSGLP
jgi:DNA-3-methyladenine glycosylase II